ncbi:MAG: 5-deoxy-glucuronate isomerase, partial [Thermoflexales bacterium]|nr:5-deoxy-glucuronate isomerase [Thermoflexales bacterium]
GFAFQRIYTDDRSPLHRAGYPIDAALTPHHNDVVVVPEGYHPVASPPGYTTYYLNMLAGSAQSLANAEDPRYAWVKDTYRAKDPRLPLYALP